MSYEDITKKAEELAEKYNPNNLSPFPYQNILEDRKDLKINLVNLPDGVSGAIDFNSEKSIFNIYVSPNKPQTRQHFTIAHELGHYFLHFEVIKGEKIIIDGEHQLDGENMLFRLDNAVATKIEIEANNFAASLIMPHDLVLSAWKNLENIEECAKIFNVSTAAMSIRLEKLGLLN